jgi:hypothetical protein
MTVCQAVGIFQQAGLVICSWSKMAILNRAGL